MINMLRATKEQITVIAIGPAPNLEAALERAPDIAEKARLVGMFGSVRVGYNGAPEPEAEWNVRADVEAARAVLAAPWEVTLTPLDTCGLLKLTGERYAAVRDAEDPLARAIIENYRLWLPHISWLPKSTDPDRESTVLFDIVAVYLAFAEDLVEIEEIGLRVTDKGMTVEDEAGRMTRCALRWRNLEGLETQIVERLTSTLGNRGRD
jgi:inosine-uridine nucleoside N-ribohydrolase